MENLEPLLKEEKEEFYFQKNEPNEKKTKVDKQIVITCVLGALMLYLLWFTLYPFYVGFKNYDLAHPKIEVTPDAEEISLEEDYVKTTYAYVDSTNNNELFNIYSDIYNIDLEVTDLNNSQKLSIILKNLGITCDNLNGVVNYEDVKVLAAKIFNDEAIVSALEEEKAGYYSITKNEDGTYNISLEACKETNDFTFKKLVKAKVLDDELYLYEAFGYFVYLGDNNYDVYGNALKLDKITTFIDTNYDKNFQNMDILRQYKWTFKKGALGYYLVSIKPMH